MPIVICAKSYEEALLLRDRVKWTVTIGGSSVLIRTSARKYILFPEYLNAARIFKERCFILVDHNDVFPERSGEIIRRDISEIIDYHSPIYAIMHIPDDTIASEQVQQYLKIIHIVQQKIINTLVLIGDDYYAIRYPASRDVMMRFVGSRQRVRANLLLSGTVQG